MMNLRVLPIILFILALTSCGHSQDAAFNYIDHFKNSRLEKLITDHPTTLHIQNQKGYTLLNYAISKGNIEAAQILLDHKVPVNQLSKSGDLPLVLAVEHGYYNIVKLLVEKYQADIHGANAVGTNPAKSAYENQKVDILDFLMKNGATKQDILSSASAQNIQNAGVSSIPFSRIENEALELIKKSELDPFIEYMDNNPALNFFASDSQGNNLLHFAVLQENTDIMISIIGKAPSLIDSVNKDLQTPLMLAAQSGIVNNARQLILLGANLKNVDKQQQSILHYAVESNSIDMLNFMLNNISNPNVSDFLKVTPLDIAAKLGNVELVQRLLESNADSSTPTRDKGYTALHFAVESQNKDVVAMLLKFQAPKNIPNLEGKLPIDIASDMNLQEIKDLLS